MIGDVFWFFAVNAFCLRKYVEADISCAILSLQKERIFAKWAYVDFSEPRISQASNNCTNHHYYYWICDIKKTNNREMNHQTNRRKYKEHCIFSGY